MVGIVTEPRMVAEPEQPNSSRGPRAAPVPEGTGQDGDGSQQAMLPPGEGTMGWRMRKGPTGDGT